MLTLAGHGFYWFELAKPIEPVADSLLAAGVVSAAEETPGDNAPAPPDTEGESR